MAADNFGNSVSWSLDQSGSDVTGQLAFESYRGGIDCGALYYNVTGSYSGTDFPLTASKTGLLYDGCGFPVASSLTEHVILSGRACGDGNGTFGGSTGGGAVSFKAVDRSGRLIEGSKTDVPRSGLKVSEPAVVPKASRPLDQNNSSTWTTVTPRFSVQYASYIPIDHIPGPQPCAMLIGGYTVYLGWNLYKGDANRGTYRTTESLLVIPGKQRSTAVFARGGPTRQYEYSSSPAAGATLSSTPNGDLWQGSYSGADEDGVPMDCHLWNLKGEADNSLMRGLGITWGTPITSVNMYGLGRDPLEPGVGGIKWNVTISLDTTDPKNPTASVSGTKTCYPAHIVKVNGTKVWEDQPFFNNTAYLLGCLVNPGFSFAPVLGVSVPPK